MKVLPSFVNDQAVKNPKPVPGCPLLADWGKMR